mmetsp:Transcript_5389/g.3109  ORF Transcript_5389/g.3109 Transcript_5389/m.3109 type:complete len:179 (+) Transcript_5389:789-1325(+)|eukprot:CAMPEP_0201283350 /NCGR_PEP_ID=MMETSP1317-20130820/8328_1 /ASSEMBLY_ACC=CAM_ASM_000770 /TAXON_ID=187299 /ORGANISM="Undescribed Undescribed, Strain Undescribed" /LENGTH=178 /DNA_ID=CAMNT_0047599323 /DNA_START=643 /DNA_END=1179 /DNA_ORIENTATION=+
MENIWTDKKFISARERVIKKNAQVELASVHSVSKGYYTECGFRGGYLELHNFDYEVNLELLKLVSIALCSSVDSQAMMGLVVNPPKPGDPSYELFQKERSYVMGTMSKNSDMIYDVANSMTGVKCNRIEGAMYAFPELFLPEKFKKEAEGKGMLPDAHYCMEALEEKGCMFVPGSGFG